MIEEIIQDIQNLIDKLIIFVEQHPLFTLVFLMVLGIIVFYAFTQRSQQKQVVKPVVNDRQVVVHHVHHTQEPTQEQNVQRDIDPLDTILYL